MKTTRKRKKCKNSGGFYKYINDKNGSWTGSFGIKDNKVILTGRMDSFVTILREQRKLSEFCFKGGLSTNLKLSKSFFAFFKYFWNYESEFLYYVVSCLVSAHFRATKYNIFPWKHQFYKIRLTSRWISYQSHSRTMILRKTTTKEMIKIGHLKFKLFLTELLLKIFKETYK